MKLIISCFLLFTSLSLAQWEILHPFNNPVPGLNYTSIDFIDSLNGWVATNKGTIIRTSDGGKSWHYQPTGTSAVLRKIRFADNLNGWAVGDSGKIIHTTNGGNSWVTQNTLANMSITMLSVVNSQKVWAAGTWGSTQQTIFLHTTSAGNSWNTIAFSLLPGEHLSDMLFLEDNIGWCSTWRYDSPFSGGYVYVTNNSGQNWSRKMISTKPQYGVFFTDENYGWSVGDWSICRTSNGGLHWSSPGTFSNMHFTDAYFIDHNIGWIFEDVYYAGYFNHSRIQFCYDGGINLTLQSTLTAGYRIYDFDVVERRIGWAAVASTTGTGGYLLNTTNGGGVFPSKPDLVYPVNFQSVSSDTINFLWTNSIPNVSGFLLSLSVDSLFQTSLDTFVTGRSLLYHNLLPNTKYFWKVKAYNNLGYGAYSNTNQFVTNLTDLENTIILPFEFSLSQNYPNPFNPSTTINYEIPSQQFVSLKVYDVLGNEVAILVNEDRSAGSYEINFDASNLSSGIYFYQLKTSEFIQTKKMIYLR
ncbi:MAG: YCF48-related protein [Ignavibacterium sp.]|nr:YCF48-related protein [Ignavibacterium sp.]